MATWQSDQLALSMQGAFTGPAIAGVAGGPQLPRATEYRGLVKEIRFSFEAATPNPMPGFGAGAIAQNDVLILAQLNDPNQRIYMGRIYVGAGWGAGVTLAVGKIDLNNPANTDPAHYLAAASIAAVGLLELNLNMTEQVGATPIGDQTVGQTLPDFGSNSILITATVGGAAPNATGTFQGFIFITEEGN